MSSSPGPDPGAEAAPLTLTEHVIHEDLLDTPEAGSRAIRASALRTAGYIAGTLITLVSAPLVVRYLGVVEFGRYMIVVSLMALVAGVTDVGLAALTLREYTVRTGPARAAFMRNVLGTRLLLTSVGVVLATTFSAVAGYDRVLVLGTLVSGASLLLGVAGHTISVPLAAELRLGWTTVADLVNRAGGVALVVILVVAHARLLPFFAVPILPAIGMLVFFVALTRGTTPLRPALDLAEIGPLLRETLPLAVATILTAVYARIVIIVLSLISTALVTGYFGTAIRVIDVAVGIPLTLVSTTFPIMARAARDNHDRLTYALQRTLEVAVIGGVWMTLVTALAARSIMLIVGGSKTVPAAPVLRILAFALLAVFINVTLQHALLSLRRHHAILFVNAAGLFAIISLTFALEPAMGARGAALAVVLGETVLTIGSAVGLLSGHPQLRPDLRVVPRVFAAVAAALMAAAATHGLGTVAVAGSATIAYFGTLAMLRAIPAELRSAIAGHLGSVRIPGWPRPRRAP